MKRVFGFLIASLLLSANMAIAAITNHTNTTTSSAVTVNATRITLASATGVTASSTSITNTLLIIDDEVISVGTLASGTTYNVTRGTRGTVSQPHASGAIVWVVAPNAVFSGFLKGSCTAATDMTKMPRIVVSGAGGSPYSVHYQNCTGGIWVNSTTFASNTPNLTHYCTVPIGSVAYGSLGTATSLADGKWWYTTIFVPQTTKFTGLKALQAGTVGTDKLVAAVWDSAGNALANSAVAGATTSGANTFLSLAFTSTVVLPGPARYIVGVQGNGTTDNIRLLAASTYIDVYAAAVAGTFGTIPTLTAPTAFTATEGSISCLY